MKKRFLLVISLVLFIFTACQNTEKQVDANKSKDSLAKNTTSSAEKAEQLCFELHYKKDVSVLKLTIRGEEVTGELNVLPFEKDASTGTLKGKKTGNIIRAEWTYMIEGTTQAEEVEFKIEGDKAFQRLSELEEKNGKLVLKETTKIEYSDPMTKIECK